MEELLPQPPALSVRLNSYPTQPTITSTKKTASKTHSSLHECIAAYAEDTSDRVPRNPGSPEMECSPSRYPLNPRNSRGDLGVAAGGRRVESVEIPWAYYRQMIIKFVPAVERGASGDH